MNIIKEEFDYCVRYGYYNDETGDFIFHNEDGPAMIDDDGTKIWYIHDRLHREDGPAMIDDDGSKIWYIHDRLHREDGPAIICADGLKNWFKHHKNITKEVKHWIEDRNLDPDNLTDEDKLALTFFMRSL